MDFPAAHALTAKVREIEALVRKARAGEPTAEDYLRAVNSDPAAEWYRDLLREKNEELEQERGRSTELVQALHKWMEARSASGQVSDADAQLIETLRQKGTFDNA